MANLSAQTLLAIGAVEGAISGEILIGNLSGAWQGAASGAIFSSIGSIAQVQGIADGSIRKVAMSGVGGGVSSVISGGKFQSGFLAAGFSEFAGPHIDKLPLKKLGETTALIAGGIARVAGGIGSVAGGGKFANGAMTATFAYAYNDLSCDQLAQTCLGVRPTKQELDNHCVDGTGWPLYAEKMDPSWVSSKQFEDIPVGTSGQITTNWTVEIVKDALDSNRYVETEIYMARLRQYE